jgi:hypothetical protein
MIVIISDTEKTSYFHALFCGRYDCLHKRNSSVSTFGNICFLVTSYLRKTRNKVDFIIFLMISRITFALPEAENNFTDNGLQSAETSGQNTRLADHCILFYRKKISLFMKTCSFVNTNFFGFLGNFTTLRAQTLLWSGI